VSRSPLGFVVASWVFAVLFAVCVLLQYNDPDPLRWMALYGAAAVASAAVPYWRRGWIAAVLVGLVAAAWALWLWAHVLGFVEVGDLWRKMSEKGGKVEEMREAGGLTIVAAWLCMSAWIGRRRDAAERG
jgi:hypothetical protein